MITIADIHKRLAENLHSTGLTQKEMAKMVGISQKTISHYVNGDKMPALDTLANLCRVFDLDPAEILCLKD